MCLSSRLSCSQFPSSQMKVQRDEATEKWLQDVRYGRWADTQRDNEEEEEEACERRGWKVTSVSKGCCCEQQLLWVTILKSREKDRKRSIVRAKHKTCTRKTKPLVLLSCCFFKVNIALLLLERKKIIHYMWWSWRVHQLFACDMQICAVSISFTFWTWINRVFLPFGSRATSCKHHTEIFKKWW